MNKIYDALIIGGGPAGLSTALGLGRIHRTCVVFSDSKFRNQGSHAAHAILTRDHTPPQEIRAIGRDQLERYGNTTFVEARIENIRKDKSHDIEMFVAEDGKGQTWIGKTVVLATGVKDVFPDLPGYVENWPHNIYQCIFCDGHERSDLPIGVLAYPTFSPMLARLVTMVHFLSKPPGDSPSSYLLSSTPNQPRRQPTSAPDPPSSKVTFFTNGPLNPSEPAVSSMLETLAAHGIRVDQRPVVKLVASPTSDSTAPEPHGGVDVHLGPSEGSTGDSAIVHLGFLVHRPPVTPSTPHLIEQLSLETTKNIMGDTVLKTEFPFNMTSEPGVFACGDIIAPMATSVPHAMVTGGAVGAGVAHMCAGIDDGLAVEAWRKGIKG